LAAFKFRQLHVSRGHRNIRSRSRRNSSDWSAPDRGISSGYTIEFPISAARPYNEDLIGITDAQAAQECAALALSEEPTIGPESFEYTSGAALTPSGIMTAAGMITDKDERFDIEIPASPIRPGGWTIGERHPQPATSVPGLGPPRTHRSRRRIRRSLKPAAGFPRQTCPFSRTR
jgi:hypothetical protein